MLLKHELFVQRLILRRGNQTRAYLDTYPNCSYRSAPSKASRLVRNGNILSRLFEFLTEQTSVTEVAINQLARALDAKKPIRCGRRLIYSPDHQTRLSAIRTIFKIQGVL